MSDDDTIALETDDELRARLRALGEQVRDRTDTEAALGRLPDRSAPPTTRLLLIAACVLAVLVIAALVPEPDTVGTTDPAQSTDCPTTEEGGAMSSRFSVPVATATTAILLIGACSDDEGPQLVARGVDIELVGGGDGFAGQTLNIDVREEGGEVTGEFRVSEIINTVRCVDTSTEGVVILGGEVTGVPASLPSDLVQPGQLNVLIIRDGDPDDVSLYGNEVGAESCGELVDSIPADLLEDDEAFIPLEAGSDIETG